VDIRKARPKVLPDPMVRVKAFTAGVAANVKMAQAYFILIGFFSGLGTWRFGDCCEIFGTL